jgi:anti-sigma B factor antagonist
MEISTRKEEACTIIDLSGEVDIHGTPRLKETLTSLTKEGTPKLLVNLSKVTYIDSSGLGVLVGALKEATKEGGRLVLAGMTRDVKTVFDLTRLAKFFEIYDVEATARSRLA